MDNIKQFIFEGYYIVSSIQPYVKVFVETIQDDEYVSVTPTEVLHYLVCSVLISRWPELQNTLPNPGSLETEVFMESLPDDVKSNLTIGINTWVSEQLHTVLSIASVSITGNDIIISGVLKEANDV